jgi:pyruvate,water dikinase
MSKNNTYILWLENVSSGDVDKVGGKNASLGEMISELKEEKIQVPEGFATTANAYWDFIKENNLKVEIQSQLKQFENDEQSPLREPENQLGDCS